MEITEPEYSLHALRRVINGEDPDVVWNTTPHRDLTPADLGLDADQLGAGPDTERTTDGAGAPEPDPWASGGAKAAAEVDEVDPWTQPELPDQPEAAEHDDPVGERDEDRVEPAAHYSEPLFTRDDIAQLTDDTVGLFFEFRDAHGYEEDRAKDAALLEVDGGVDEMIRERVAERFRGDSEARRAAARRALADFRAARQQDIEDCDDLDRDEPARFREEERQF